MENLQTKPLVPEWVKKLAEILKMEYTVVSEFIIDDGDYIEATQEELAEFIWEQIVKDVIPNDLPS